MPSTVIRSFDYRPEGHELEVTFITGRRYLYFDVPQDVVDAFRSAASKGVFFNTRIRPYFEYREIAPA
jgi:lysyl-tRNA synthetase class 2